MSRVLPSLYATSSTASRTFFSAFLRFSVAPSSASLTAAIRVPAQVRKSAVLLPTVSVLTNAAVGVTNLIGKEG